ncbi:MAG: calcium/sodium antiporter [Pseudomonadota bacterium]
MVLIGGLILGFVLLVAGGEILVRGAVGAAEKMGVSPLLIGLTLVGFGTSMPEMVVSVQAVFAGSPGLAMGNIVGSNISNTLLIVGFSALLLPMAVARKTIKRDGVIGLATTGAFIAISAALPFDPTVGFLLIAMLIAYLSFVWIQDRDAHAISEAEAGALVEKVNVGSILLSVAIAILGMVVVVTGGTILVENAIAIARIWNVPDEVIGLTIVAIGTSLPELVTAVVAAFRGASDIALGSVLGSNMFNMLSIGGVTSVLAPTPFTMPEHIVVYDNFVMISAVLLLLFFAWTRNHISRSEGAVLLFCYIAYITSLVLFELQKAAAVAAS